MGSVGSNKNIAVRTVPKGVVQNDNTIEVSNGVYKIPVITGNKFRVKVFSATNKFFAGEYFDIYSVNKNAYVKDTKGRKYYLKDARLSANGNILYV